MATTTTKLGLRKPDPNPSTGDFINVTTDINNSMDTLDSAVGVFICTSGTRPTGSQRWDGRDIFETDTRRRYMWSASVNDWLPILQSRAAGGPTLLNGSTDTSGEGLNIQASVSGADILRARVTGDSNTRFLATAAGTLSWGPGNAAADTNLYRSTANELRTDDSLVVSGNLFVGTNLSQMMLKAYENILAAGNATLGSYTPIPSTFRHLRIHIVARGAAASQYVNVRMRFNNDSSAVYNHEQLYGFAATPGAGETLSDTSFLLGDMPGSTTVAGSCASWTVTINDYARTNFWKSIIVETSLQAQTSAGQASVLWRKSWAGFWRSTAAITRLDVISGSGNFDVGSTITVYGLP